MIINSAKDITSSVPWATSPGHPIQCSRHILPHPKVTFPLHRRGGQCRVPWLENSPLTLDPCAGKRRPAFVKALIRRVAGGQSTVLSSDRAAFPTCSLPEGPAGQLLLQSQRTGPSAGLAAAVPGARSDWGPGGPVRLLGNPGRRPPPRGCASLWRLPGADGALECWMPCPGFQALTASVERTLRLRVSECGGKAVGNEGEDAGACLSVSPAWP